MSLIKRLNQKQAFQEQILVQIQEEKYDIHSAIGNVYYTPTELKLLESNRNLPFSGFQFCSHVTGQLDTVTVIVPQNKTLAEWNPDKNVFINLVDSLSYELFLYLMTIRKDVDQQETRRLACYLTLLNESPLIPLSHSPLIKDIDTTLYFQSVLPTSMSIIPKNQKEYQVAFLLMVHDIDSLYQIKELLSALDSPDAIFLIHVDYKSKILYASLSKWMESRENMHMASLRFSNIWGHISLVYTQLSGFWELAALGTWSHVINLSADDWPLVTTPQMIDFLSQHKESSFIQYWSDTNDLAGRIGRSFIALADRKEAIHLQELGLTSHPNYKYYKHHQWMTLNYEAVQHLQSPEVLRMLAEFEFTYIADESFFATALLNSKLANTILNHNNRYVRIQGAHPDWLGYRDRHYFPPSTESPTLFIRKLKITGSVFEEAKLLHWIKENQEKTTCDLERASGDSWCLGSLLRNQTKSKQVILIPVNQGFLEIAQNLECSLSQLNLTKNIVYWSLDIHTHEYFLRKNKISVFLPGGVEVDGLHGKQSHPLQAMMKQKPRIIQYILDSGFGVWFLDADTVVFKNITETIEDGVDVYLGLANLDYISDMGYNPSASIMYFENSLGSRHVLDVWKKAIASSVRLDDSVALKKALKQFVVMDPRTNVLINETPVVKYLDGELFLTLQEESLLKDPYLVHLGKHQVDDFKAKKLWFMGPPCQPIKVPQ